MGKANRARLTFERALAKEACRLLIADYHGRDLDDCFENGVDCKTLAFHMGQHCGKLPSEQTMKVHGALAQEFRDSFERGHVSVAGPRVN